MSCGGPASNVVGAVFQVCGTTTDVMGSTKWGGVGRTSQTGTQVYIKTYNVNSGISETGNLSRQ
ncbi:MAG: hypothetical protein ACRD40_01725 [Candidatus Acidiferrales bacterium]